jgi:hypothetical protein
MPGYHPRHTCRAGIDFGGLLLDIAPEAFPFGVSDHCLITVCEKFPYSGSSAAFGRRRWSPGRSGPRSATGRPARRRRTAIRMTDSRY